MLANRLVMLLIAAIAVMASAFLLLAGPPALAQSGNCQSSTSPSATYTVTICLSVQTPNGTIPPSVSQVQATISVTGTNPGIQRAVFYLDGQYLISTFGVPFAFDLPTDWWVDGPHTLAVEALMRDGFTSAQASLGLTFQNGVAQPPVNTGSFTPVGGFTGLNRPLIVAATGDGGDGQQDSADVVNVIQAASPDLFLFLGDLYEKGSPVEFYNWYGVPGKLFGKFRSITNPTVGNHEYSGGQAIGYFDYWDNIPSYYSYDAAGWHFVSLNANSQSGGYSVGTPQYNWLAQDLSASNAPCTVVYFHHPRYTVGPQGDKTALADVWTLMAQHGVDIVLTGHDHSYQRWQPLDQNGNVASQGITEFVAGGGGHGIQNFVRTDPRLVIGYDTPSQAFGALRFEMNQKGAAFRYTNTKNAILDSGVIPCWGPGASSDTVAPSTPQNLTATITQAGQVLLQWQASQDDTGVAGYTIYRNGALLATVGGVYNTFVDTTTAFDTTYTYHVDAFDLASYHSAQSNQATATTASSSVLTFNPSADTYVSADFPDANYGSAIMLRTDVTPTMRSYLRFNIQGISGHINRATLRLHANNGSGIGYRISQLSNSNWTELGTTYNNAPALGNFVGTSGAYALGSWTSVDVTSLVTGDGVLELGVDTISSTTLNFGSREDANKPVLEVEVSSAPPPPPLPGIFTYTVVADSYVTAISPTTNFGNVASVKVDALPDTRSYLRFNVQGLAGTVMTATLRVSATSASNVGYHVRGVSDNTWTETGLNYNNAPPTSTVVAGTSGAFAATTWTTANVTSLVGGNGTVNLALTGTSNTGISFSSREGATPPLLVVTTIGQPTVDTTPPTPPGNLTEVAASATHVDLSWTAATDSGGIAGYTILRDGSTVGSVNGAILSFVDTSVQGSTSYVYTVVAVDNANNSSQPSNQVNVTTPPPQDTTPPTAPSNLIAVAASATRVNLSWSAATDSSGIANYIILRDGATVGGVNGATLSFADTSVQGGQSYVYTVVAKDIADFESEPSNAANVTTPAPPDTTPPTAPGTLTAVAASATRVDLSWSAATDNIGIANYIILRDGATVGGVNGATLSYADTSVQGGQSYVYTVVAKDMADFESEPSNAANVTTPAPPDTTPPTAPGNLTAVAASATRVNLTWSASTDSNGIAGYIVKRDGAVVANVNGAAVESVTGATLGYTDTSVQGSTSYAYTVVAVDNAGNESQLSNQVSVTTPAELPGGSDPAIDSDGDGLPDLWEVKYGLNPQDGTGSDGASGDPDGDGFSNLDEYNRQTDPNRFDKGTETLYLPLISLR